MEKSMEKVVALAKARGFVYPGSEIYGGLANTWDYGNLGVELKNNVKRAWWQKFIQENPYNVGVDCAILMNPQTWVASGHLGGFSDPLMDCRECTHFAAYTGDSFRDLTRIARINENMWTELFLANREALLSQMDLFAGKFMELRDALDRSDAEKLKAMMRLSTRRRSSFDKD